MLFFLVRFPVWLNVLKYSPIFISKSIKEKQCRQFGPFTAVTSKWSLLGKGKGHAITCHEGIEGQQRYSSALSLTFALDGGRWSTPRPDRFTPYPLYRKLGGPHGRSERVQKISPPNGIRPPDRPPGSGSLYRLRYHDPKPLLIAIKKGRYPVISQVRGIADLWEEVERQLTIEPRSCDDSW
jgi:hypothetical protein